jgi:hypothetical protein
VTISFSRRTLLQGVSYMLQRFNAINAECEGRMFKESGGGGEGSFAKSKSKQEELGITQPPIKWVPGVLSRGVKLTPHLHLVPRSRMRGAKHQFPQYSVVWCSDEAKRLNSFLDLGTMPGRFTPRERAPRTH